jgi:EAL domain-containing protein (putative c-di-GMP-specific phosphodiesterase class I)
MRTGQLVGAEALIRWQHPTRGLLAPAAFLSAIETHPLAIEVGEWVMDAALTQMAAWQAQGLTLPVSVNVGALQLQQADFLARPAHHLIQLKSPCVRQRTEQQGLARHDQHLAQAVRVNI